MGVIAQGVDVNNIVYNLHTDPQGNLYTHGDTVPNMNRIDDLFREVFIETATAGGDLFRDFTAVPIGYFYIVEGIAFKCFNRAMAHPYISMISGTNNLLLDDVPSLAANTFEVFKGPVTLRAGELIEIVFRGIVIGDTLHWRYFGRVVIV